jgi:hypothetical protein
MASIVVGPQIGEIVEDGKVIQKNYICWCGYCLNKLIKDFHSDSPKNKKIYQSCEMRDGQVTEKDGKITYLKTCLRCHQTLVLFDKFWEEARRG